MTEEEKIKEQEALLDEQLGITPEDMTEPVADDAPINGMDIVNQKIRLEDIQRARQILQKYKEGKANLEKRIIENEQWYKLRHWECMRKSQSEDSQAVEPVSGWLFNSIANKHADAMDNFPSFNILPREEGDVGEAKQLSSIVPVVLDQNDFEETYDRFWDYKLKAGTGVYGVFWDSGKLNGLGDISINREDVLNLFWEPGITDIQESQNFFHVALQDNEVLKEQYPILTDTALGSSTMDLSKYVYDDSVDTTDKSAVIDWYYKKHDGNRTILHYVKFVNDTILAATENETEPPMNEMGMPVGKPLSEAGLYDHGMYPYLFDPLFPVEGSPCGFGYIDVGKSAQEYIDRCNASLIKNVLANATPRNFIREDGEVNEEEYLDLNNPLVHYAGNPDSILPITPNPLNPVYVQILHDKIDELKEVTGNRDVSNGGTTGGATAASAVAAMQEASGKLSRDSSRSAYRTSKRLVLMVIELIRQFYDAPRTFRITGDNGQYGFVSYDNSGIRPQDQGGMAFGVDMEARVPLFDVDVEAQRQSPYTKLSQNELALQFYSAGFFNPANHEQATLCMEMMDFPQKDIILQKIAQNGMIYQQMLMAQMQMGMMPQAEDQPQGGGQPELKGGESSVTQRARAQAAQTTDPT